MLNFLPKSEQDLLELMPDGEYDFLVRAAENYRNPNNGNQSIKLTVEVYDKNGKAKSIFCYLSPNFLILLKHFCDAVGLEYAYQAGTLSAEMCLSQSGRCKVIIKQPKEGTNYQPKNEIKDFIKGDKKPMIPPATDNSKDDGFDNDLPF